MKGLVFDFHRGTTYDGPGMRTTVFFKGCPLQCRWCHNPEGINPNPEIQWTENKCIGCLSCVNTCKSHAIRATEAGIVLNRDICQECYECVESCPSKALKLVGQYWTVEALVKEACKDHMFFDGFNGGVTVSGGEPILQFSFLIDFLKELKNQNIDIALDTSGFGKRDAYERIYPYIDTFLYDIKFMDEALHVKYTGVSNKLILSNLKYLVEKMRRQKDAKLWIRTPLIPQATATEENIAAIGQFIQKELSDVIERWELCAFNNVCREKYRKLGKKWEYESVELMNESQVKALADTARKYVKDLLVCSGMTKK